MASIKYTALVNEIKGKIAGTVFQGGYAGTVVKGKNKTRYAPIAPPLVYGGTTVTMSQRYILSRLASNWKDLSDAERLSWSAAAPNYPFKNRFGETYIGSGFQLYVSINSKLASFGLTELTAAPAVGIVPDPPTNSPGVFLTVGGIIIIFTDYQNPGPCQRVSVSTPTGPGTDAARLSYKVSQIVTLAASDDVDYAAGLIAVRGPNVVGQVYWLKFEAINPYTGQMSVPYYVSATITD